MKINLPKMEYGDFYKFVTSFFLMLFIFGTSAIIYALNFMPRGGLKNFLIFFYFSLFIILVLIFIWTLNNWWKKQRVLDQKEKEELELKRAKKEYINAKTTREILGPSKLFEK